MRGIFLPALSEEQQHWATSLLSEIGGLDWSTAKQVANRTPGIVFVSADEDQIGRLYNSLEKTGLKPTLHDLDSLQPAPVTAKRIRTDDRSVEQYGILMKYLQYENAMYWGRANFYLLANAALLGFVTTNLPPMRPLDPTGIRILAFASIAGLFLVFQWFRGLQAGEFWIDHWHELLKDMEENAFGERKILRRFEPRPGGPRPVRARRVARSTTLLFGILWSLNLTYLVWVLVRPAP